MKKILTIMLAVVLAFVITGCSKDAKENENKGEYADYLGYQFSGQDPWGTELAVTIREIKDDKITWTYTDTLTKEITIYQKLTTDFKDDKSSFTLKGEEDNYSYNYSGRISLKDGKVTVKYSKGKLTTKSSEGDSSSHQVEALESAAKTVTLTKVVDNS
jgi:ABC-type glycerol-3-phosphate transport system substrate-binding protein